MTRVWILFIMLALGGATLSAQTTPSIPTVPPAAELAYFRYVFMSLGAPDITSVELQSRRSLFVQQFRLTSEDAALINVVAEEFRTAILQINSDSASALAHGSARTPTENQYLAAIEIRRNTAILKAISRLKLGLTAGSATRLWQPPAAFVAGNYGRALSQKIRQR